MENNGKSFIGNSPRDCNRVELWKVVPRSVPFAIGIAPSDLCNFRCIYCGHSTESGIKGARVLKWDEFIEITHQIEEILEKGSDDLKIIRLIGNGEPLINKDLPRMVAYLSEKKYASRIEVTTNGSLLTHEISDALIDAGLTRLLVSVQGTSNKKYQEICKYNMDIDQFVERIEYFYKHKKQCGLYVKTVDVALEDEDDRKRFIDTYKDICDTVCVEETMNTYSSVDYSSISDKDIDHATRYGGTYKKMICCNTLFMYMNIHSNGNVDCCGCKYPPLFIGNVFKTPLKDLWNGRVHKEYMMKHLNGNRDDILCCKNCAIESFGSFPEDILDEHMEDILKRVELL